jgi:hypothetical protein
LTIIQSENSGQNDKLTVSQSENSGQKDKLTVSQSENGKQKINSPSTSLKTVDKR